MIDRLRDDEYIFKCLDCPLVEYRYRLTTDSVHINCAYLLIPFTTASTTYSPFHSFYVYRLPDRAIYNRFHKFVSSQASLISFLCHTSISCPSPSSVSCQQYNCNQRTTRWDSLLYAKLIPQIAHSPDKRLSLIIVQELRGVHVKDLRVYIKASLHRRLLTRPQALLRI